jgi:hypothetical protein
VRLVELPILEERRLDRVEKKSVQGWLRVIFLRELRR